MWRTHWFIKDTARTARSARCIIFGFSRLGDLGWRIFAVAPHRHGETVKPSYRWRSRNMVGNTAQAGVLPGASSRRTNCTARFDFNIYPLSGAAFSRYWHRKWSLKLFSLDWLEQHWRRKQRTQQNSAIASVLSASDDGNQPFKKIV